jgi:hypothetical protein
LNAPPEGARVPLLLFHELELEDGLELEPAASFPKPCHPGGSRILHALKTEGSAPCVTHGVGTRFNTRTKHRMAGTAKRHTAPRGAVRTPRGPTTTRKAPKAGPRALQCIYLALI